ncbi:MAG: YtxH domain-containing protein [Gloeobacteraceae cyanobacterium ES-bin-316]|nr:YtxH domain-containing protein [Ferruginibacter sp.]
MSSSKTLLGFVAGAAVGALAGILLAPEKGSETRKKITSKTGDLADSVKNSFGDFIDQVKNAYSKAGETAEDLEQHTRAKMNNLKGEVAAGVDNSF